MESCTTNVYTPCLYTYLTNVFCLEMTGLNLTTFSDYPVVSPTQQVMTLNGVPALDPSHMWLPCLEEVLYTDDTTSAVLVQNPSGNILAEIGVDCITTASNTHKLRAAKGDSCTENGFNTSNLQVQNSAIEDTLYDQIVQLEEFNGEVIRNYSNTPKQIASVQNGIPMEVVDSGEKTVWKESENMERKLEENPTVPSGTKRQDAAISKSPKTPRKAGDYRRRREKANEREKQRIVVLKNAMNVLKNAIPAAREKRRVTKLEVLKLAQDYISSLKAQLMEEPEDNEDYMVVI